MTRHGPRLASLARAAFDAQPMSRPKAHAPPAAPPPSSSPSSSTREPVRADAASPRTAASTSGNGGKDFEYKIALGSSGWLFVYYIGVVKAMRERGLHEYVVVVVVASSRVRARARVYLCVLCRAFEYSRLTV